MSGSVSGRVTCTLWGATYFFFILNTRVRDKKRLEKVGNLVKNSYLYR